MKLKQESRVLKGKALASLVAAVEAYNSPYELGRVSRVLLLLQHSFEMLLKAALVQTGEKKIFDPGTGRSIGFEKCLNLAASNRVIKLADADAGALRAVDAMRDDEQHWFNVVSEQLLYLHARAAITLYDELLQRVFADHLANHLPIRVLPLSVDPPRDLTVLIDEEYSQIAKLLKPGRRARHEARARLRTLLALEAHSDPDTGVSVKDVDRVERGVREGHPWETVFPRLKSVQTAIDGAGLTLTVRFTKAQGAPVTFVADDSTPAAGIREVDLTKKYHRAPKELAEALDISAPRSTALRKHLGLDEDGPFSHLFELGSIRQRRYSDNAFTTMRVALKTLDMEAVWEAHKSRGGSKKPAPACTVSGCHAPT